MHEKDVGAREEVPFETVKDLYLLDVKHFKSK
jgi:hypothetical protein